MSASNWSQARLSNRQIIYAVGDVLSLFALRDAMLASADEGDRVIIDLDMATLRCTKAHGSRRSTL
jgi:ribonuclease D